MDLSSYKPAVRSRRAWGSRYITRGGDTLLRAVVCVTVYHADAVFVIRDSRPVGTPMYTHRGTMCWDALFLRSLGCTIVVYA